MPVELLTEVSQASVIDSQHSVPVELRLFPYPYRAMLAICSDLDETADAGVYAEQMRFLNTREWTAMGEGVGLEIGNSIYFDMPPGQFAYWNTTDAGRAMARALIASGHIDCLHSFGDLATTRAHAARALEELSRHSLSLKVWVDHAVAPTNFGADIMHGHGDEVGHAAYHADLTMAHGIRYVWRGRVTSIIGQGSRVNMAACRSRCHPRASPRAVIKETAKQFLGRAGHRKYRFHAANHLCAAGELRDGRSVVEFLRCNPHPHGLDFGDTGMGVSEVLTPDFLDRLLEQQGTCVLYTHLGKLRGRQFDRAAIASFRLLARYQEERKLLVTTTRRLLDFHHAHKHLKARVSVKKGKTIIDLELPVTADGLSRHSLTASELSGITIYVSGSDDFAVLLNGVELPNWQMNPADETGRRSISIPWTRLSFPSL